MKSMMPFCLVGLLAACSSSSEPDVKKHFIKDGEKHPLVVVFGGSEGGNTLAKPLWQPFLNSFHDMGLSVAAVGYYGTESTPSQQVELSLEDIAARINTLAKDPYINENCIAVYGFSKGAELALLLGSHFDNINHVVAVMPTHVSWNAVKTPSSRSGWTLKEQPLNYVDAPLLSWKMQRGNFTGEFTPAFEQALSSTHKDIISAARIPIEKNKGPILLVSAKQDEVWPSYMMSNQIIKQLDKVNYPHAYQHIALEGGHYTFNRDTQTQVGQFLKETLISNCQ
ncbi:acyl-CoA thioester hydrolase/BAAT C-terminal domain-containing protein [Pseudoalteromonas luteoviolacea]|uniref:BAAT/Acyl-CoA thioester hydrolase C-terminal domain-containing protein n=1 Tax=Pseudoalteromonas luteoviolacea H33 TaxID=1365251 RepID=A0A162A895_9GAMM|nr:acyl-CoA thioester hydrolase/BAAT C-terminal domain-containing protein [Pseudoalteromonas luteoviolacea]KZN45713.1 hypothetical protein N476_25135 [Pseudoalteromonas luteoviolacea H33]KZN73970.1 hypothetical protein N477_22510 [Pseudoalteromonas luteoviolacea H33-S]